MTSEALDRVHGIGVFIAIVLWLAFLGWFAACVTRGRAPCPPTATSSPTTSGTSPACEPRR